MININVETDLKEMESLDRINWIRALLSEGFF
jgi:hypothetical protein